MEVLYGLCCGLDAHKEDGRRLLAVSGARGQRAEEVRTFGTTTRELIGLADWLHAAGCTHAAMESTGSTGGRSTTSWRAAWSCCSVNAQHVKAVPGRKTDVRTASGSRSCWSMDCCAGALSPRPRSASCAS
jgi:hypothetical protein